MQADLALIGFGNVGRRFVELLERTAERLAADHDLTCRVVASSTRRGGAVYDGERCADTFDVIRRLGASTADLRIVVETTTLDIKAGEPATSHVRAAIAAGCHVVTANKGPVAFAYAELA